MKSTVTVLFDHQIFSMQKFGGISNCFAMNIREFADKDLGISPRFGWRFSNCAHLENDCFAGHAIRFPSRRYIRNVFIASNRWVSTRMKSGVDVVHHTYYLDRDLPCRSENAVVSTVHDMTPEIMEKLFAERGNPHRAKRQYCDLSHKIVCVSENTRRDLIELYSVPKEKTEVVYHGIDLEECQAEVGEAGEVPEEFVLYVGRRRGYKNFALLVRSFSELSCRRRSLHLLCAGGAPFTEEEKERLRDAGVASRVRQVPIDDRRLRALYRKARCFVFPSLYEGFGMPILEAFAQRCPVVLSNASCFPEIAQEAGIYFDPRSEESCSAALDKALSEDNADRLNQGIARCGELTWEASARKLAKVYREAVEIHRG